MSLSHQMRRRIAEHRDAYVAWGVTVVPFAALVAGLALYWRGLGLTVADAMLFVAFYSATILGVEVGYHRYFSHGAFACGPRLRAVLAVLGSMSFQGPVIWWAASHRRHHRHADQPEDPHSPHFHGAGAGGLFRGLVHAHMGWLFHPGSLFPTADYERYVTDLLRDRVILAVHFNYVAWIALSLGLPTLLGWAFSGGQLRGAVVGFLWAGLIRVFFVNHSIWAVNSICHTFGRHALRSPDRSTNNAWLALPSFGAAWHNNHHAFARTASNAFAWWQVDLGGLFVRALERIGLVWDVRMPTPEMIAARRLAEKRAPLTGDDVDAIAPADTGRNMRGTRT